MKRKRGAQPSDHNQKRGGNINSSELHPNTKNKSRQLRPHLRSKRLTLGVFFLFVIIVTAAAYVYTSTARAPIHAAVVEEKHAPHDVKLPPFADFHRRQHLPLTRNNIDLLRRGLTTELMDGVASSKNVGGAIDALTAEDVDLMDALLYLFPPSQRAHRGRQVLDELLSFGTRVVGQNREAVMEHLVCEGLGTRRYDANNERYIPGVAHLSSYGVELLENSGRGPAGGVQKGQQRGTYEEPDLSVPVRRGWWWSLTWDNFTESVPPPLRVGHFNNLVFHFRGGSRFQAKQSLETQEDPGVIYEQENLMERDPLGKHVHRMEKARHRTHHLSPSGRAVRLKPTLGHGKAAAAHRQPLRHVLLTAHWDTKMSPEGFLGACDSTVPILYLVRTIKNIAALTDVAEALTALYLERAAKSGISPTDIPGVHTLFRSRPAEEVKNLLAEVLSPAHHTLLYDYYFANGRHYTEHRGVDGEEEPSSRRVVDVRTWLDWVQHLPAISAVLFDGEEAIEEWSGNDNTYGSRHLSERWARQPGGGNNRTAAHRQTRLDTVDLFALYDLMGVAGMSFMNLFPTQSGVFYGGLAAVERSQRRRALASVVSISRDLLSQKNERFSRYVMGTLWERASAALASWSDGDAYRMAAPTSWQLFGSPHDIFTLFGHKQTSDERFDADALVRGRTYDELLAAGGEGTPSQFEALNRNIFFDVASSLADRRPPGTPWADDDHRHWLDTQRVLHLISIPFPTSWHTMKDDGANIHDGSSADLEKLLWDFTLMLGEYWETQGNSGE